MGISTEVEFFKKISDYFWRQTKKDGSLTCPKHRVEHTGKNVYSAVIDMRLYRLTGQEDYYQRAKLRVQRTVQKLVQDPDFGYWIFYPGRLNRWNMANSVIDAGACVDVLATFYLDYQDRLSEKEKQEIKEAIFKVSDGYLNKATVTKEITNQRLWGGTGLSRAYQIFKEEKWRQSLLNSIERSIKEMWPDGTFPYHSYWQEYRIFKGIYDTTTYYQSRCIAFIYYILENIGEDLDKYREKLIKAADLLVVMYQPNGIKNINLECKRWYWLSSYEVASNAFDVYTLTKTYEITGNEIYAYYAKRALNQILNHLLLDKGITSHLNEAQNNFQCRVFWNAHLAWLSRTIDKAFDLPQQEIKERLQYFPDSAIVKFKNENYSCILRGKKQPMSLMLGPAIGGSILYFGRKNDWQNNLDLKLGQENAQCNFTFFIKENYLHNLKEFLVANKKEIRSKIYHALVELRAPNFRSFFTYLFYLYKMIINGAKGVYASQWAVNVFLKKEENKITFETIPAKRNGQELIGVSIKREYVFNDNSLFIKEDLSLENKKLKKLKYNKCPIMQDLKINTNLRYKDSPKHILFYINRPKFSLEITYSLN